MPLVHVQIMGSSGSRKLKHYAAVPAVCQKAVVEGVRGGIILHWTASGHVQTGRYGTGVHIDSDTSDSTAFPSGCYREACLWSRLALLTQWPVGYMNDILLNSRDSSYFLSDGWGISCNCHQINGPEPKWWQVNIDSGNGLGQQATNHYLS